MKSIIANMILVVVALALALALVEAFLRIRPELVSSVVRVNPPVRSVNASADEFYEYKPSNGDLFYWLGDSISPVEPDQDDVIVNVHFITDENGFRNHSDGLGETDVVVTGDSFTEGRGAADPWPQRLSEYLELDVYNLANSAFGPLEEYNVLSQYGPEANPDWVIFSFFEGNDLREAAAYDQAIPLITLRLGRYYLDRIISNFRSGGSAVEADNLENPAKQEIEYRYPIQVSINGNDQELAFLPGYVSWLSASESAIEQSENYKLTTDTILKAKELSDEIGARFLVQYIPSKPHIYLPHITEKDSLNRIFSDARLVEQDEDGYLLFSEKLVTPEIVMAHLDDQLNVMEGFAASNEIEFIDLTPVFQAETSKGAALYYLFDTHWNQAGHDLAARITANYMLENQ